MATSQATNDDADDSVHVKKLYNQRPGRNFVNFGSTEVIELRGTGAEVKAVVVEGQEIRRT